MIAILKLYQRFAAITTTIPLVVSTPWLLCNKSRKKVPEKNIFTGYQNKAANNNNNNNTLIIITSIQVLYC